MSDKKPMGAREQSELVCRCGHSRDSHDESKPWLCTLCDDNTCHGFNLRDSPQFHVKPDPYAQPMSELTCIECGNILGSNHCSESFKKGWQAARAGMDFEKIAAEIAWQLHTCFYCDGTPLACSSRESDKLKVVEILRKATSLRPETGVKE